MAVWQFDLQLMPDQVVPDAPDCIESAITDDGLDTMNWWLANQPKDDYRQIIANAFSPLDSWCPEILRWGDENKVLVEAFISDGTLEGIGIRVDVRNIDRELINTMTQLVAKLDCQIYVMETQQKKQREAKEKQREAREAKGHCTFVGGLYLSGAFVQLVF